MRWRLTAAGERLLTEGTERIYAFTGAHRDWDGSWLLVLARVPETDRAARHLLRTRLGWAGLGSPAPGVWLTTHAERHLEVEQVLRQAGIADGQVFVASHRGGGSLAGLVAQAWDLPMIEERYEEFLAEFAVSPGSTGSTGSSSSSVSFVSSVSLASAPLTRLVELVHAWRRFPSIDPGLPLSLLPSGWSGERAAELFADRHAAWSSAAVTQWLALNDQPP